MADITLFLGNKNYSSWSMRPYLALKHVGVPFDDVVVPLRHPDTADKIARFTPAGRVPVLRHGDTTIWDSLAICEYLAETFPSAHLWPADRAARATARSVSSEMHSGFTALRGALPMNVRASKPQTHFATDVTADIDRVKGLWRDCRKRYGAGGPFLFGAFTNADAMYGAVVSRFRTYGVPLGDVEAAYVEAVWNLPQMQEWVAAAKSEPWAIKVYDDM
jgi:glutathione S-transferase